MTNADLAPRLTGIVLKQGDGTDQIFYQPTARQLQFHTNPAPYRLYGGAAGGGKSHAIRMEAYMRCFLIPGYRVLLMRRVLPELKKTHLIEVPREMVALFQCGQKGAPKLGDLWRASDHLLTLPNGSTIQFGSADHDGAVTKFLSTEYDAFFPDELTTFDLNTFRMIESRIGRRAGMPWTIAGGTNPVGIGSAWCKTLWITKDPSPDEAPKYNPADYAYIPATIDDNPHVSGDYGEKLENLPSEALRQAFRHGSWEFLEGQFFSEFRSDKAGAPWHVVSEMPTVGGRLITDHDGLEWFRAIDWGIANLAVCGWYCALPSGRVVKVFERTWKDFIPAQEMGREIAAFTRKHVKGKVRYTVADPKTFSREGALGESVAEALAKGGVPCLRADNERELGWAQVKGWLRTLGPDGKPLLQFYGPGCPHTIKTLPTLVARKGNPDDIEKGLDDHCADETRYALMSRPAPSKIKAQADTRIANTVSSLSPDFKAFLRPTRGKTLDLKRRFSLKVS